MKLQSMRIIKNTKAFFSKPFFCNYNTLLGLWIGLGVIAWLTKYFPEKYNNFLIFKNVFWHTIHQTPLFASYPEEYFDVNHYGPFFSLVIAPFAIPPIGVGLLMWSVLSALFLYVAVKQLPMQKPQHILIYWFCAHELLTALFMSQFNIAITAIIVLSFVFIRKEKDVWAAFVIVLGTFVKLYGIVGLAFFFFSKHKIKFIISCLVWSVIMFVAPMLLSGPDYIISQYTAWYENLITKNSGNMFSVMQNVSFLGMVRKATHCATYSDIWLILCGLIIFALPYLRIKQYKNLPFQLTLLASVLLFTVLFSTGSESSTYIIALTGVAIWYTAAPWKRSKTDLALMIFAFLLTSMSPSDLFPKYIRVHYVYPYALKALPCMLIWLKLSYEMYSRNYCASQKNTDPAKKYHNE